MTPMTRSCVYDKRITRDFYSRLRTMPNEMANRVAIAPLLHSYPLRWFSFNRHTNMDCRFVHGFEPAPPRSRCYCLTGLMVMIPSAFQAFPRTMGMLGVSMLRIAF